jgi:Arc/MetJ family transcription regulator
LILRTNIVIDDNLMEQAMRVSGLSTKKEVVDRALSEFVQRHTRKDLLELRGKIQFADNYDYKAMRKGR